MCHRELGFTPVEVNASDTRNKADNSALKGVGAKLANSIKELATNTAIGMGADHKPKKVSPQELYWTLAWSSPASHGISCNSLIRQVCSNRCADLREMLTTIMSMLVTIGDTDSCPVCIKMHLVSTEFSATAAAVWLAARLQ